MAFIVDLETVAIDGAEALVEPAQAPSNYKDPQKIADYIKEAQRKQVEQAAIYPYTNRIVALGWCEETDDVETVSLINNEATEARALGEFWSRVVDSRTGHVESLVTFNGRRFDLPTLMVRSRFLGVRAPALNLDRYRSPHPDLLDVLTFGGTIESRSLGWYAKRFGLNTDDAFSGKHIGDLYADGNWDAIQAHCESDVRLTRQIAEILGVVRRRPVASSVSVGF